MLQDAGLLSEERTGMLLSWRYTGFSVHNRVRVGPEDGAAVERLARCIMQPPISLRQNHIPYPVARHLDHRRSRRIDSSSGSVLFLAERKH